MTGVQPCCILISPVTDLRADGRAIRLRGSGIRRVALYGFVERILRVPDGFAGLLAPLDLFLAGALPVCLVLSLELPLALSAPLLNRLPRFLCDDDSPFQRMELRSGSGGTAQDSLEPTREPAPRDVRGPDS